MAESLQQKSQAQYHSLDEFADKLAKKLGQHYGMSDIREQMLEEFLQTRPKDVDLTEEDIMNEVRTSRGAQ